MNRRRPNEVLSRCLLVMLMLGLSAGCSQQPRVPDQSLSSGIGFRGGPQRTGLIDGDGPSHPKERWSVDTGGHVTSSPVPLEDGVVVLGGDGNLRRIDVDGTQQWTRHIGQGDATPVVIGDVVVQPSSSGSLAAVSVNDGEVIWNQNLGGSVRSSALVANGKLMVGVGDEVVVVGVSDGTVLSRFPLGADTGSSPALSNDVIVIGDSDNLVLGLNSGDGSRRWAYDFGPTPQDVFRVADGVVATPAIANGVVYVGSVNGALAALDGSDGSLRWEVTLDGPIYSSAAVGEAVFATTAAGSAVALDPQTGRQIWATSLGDASYASPTLTNDLLMVTTEEGVIYGLDPVDGAVTWQVTIGVKGNYMASTPTLVSGVVVAGANTGRVVGLSDDVVGGAGE